MFVVAERRPQFGHGMAQRFDDLDRIGTGLTIRDSSEDWNPLPVPISSVTSPAVRLADLRHVGLAQIVRQGGAVSERPGLRIRPHRPRLTFAAMLGVVVMVVFAGHGLERADDGRCRRCPGAPSGRIGSACDAPTGLRAWIAVELGLGETRSGGRTCSIAVLERLARPRHGRVPGLGDPGGEGTWRHGHGGGTTQHGFGRVRLGMADH